MKISRSALLPYSTHQMFDVVADIRSYPAFLNWCEATEIISEQDDEVVAKLIISYTKLNIDFTTRNINTKDESIKLSLVDGPFTALSGEWVFEPLSDGACKVTLDMEFDFEQSFAKAVMAKVFAKIITTQIDAFQSRAKQLYGDPNA